MPSVMVLGTRPLSGDQILPCDSHGCWLEALGSHCLLAVSRALLNGINVFIKIKICLQDSTKIPLPFYQVRAQQEDGPL